MSVDKKHHIINAAIELFARKGFEGTSVRDIAAGADVNLAMINYYFGSKEGLFQQLVDEKISFMREKIAELHANKQLSELEKVDIIIESYVERFLTEPEFHRVLQQEMLFTNREILHEKAIESFIQNSKNFKEIIEQGIKKKIFKKVDAPLVFASIIGTLNQVLKSRKICNVFIGKDKDFDPYKDEHFKKRVINHIKQMIHSHLLIQS